MVFLHCKTNSIGVIVKRFSHPLGLLKEVMAQNYYYAYLIFLSTFLQQISLMNLPCSHMYHLLVTDLNRLNTVKKKVNYEYCQAGNFLLGVILFQIFTTM